MTTETVRRDPFACTVTDVVKNVTFRFKFRKNVSHRGNVKRKTKFAACFVHVDNVKYTHAKVETISKEK